MGALLAGGTVSVLAPSPAVAADPSDDQSSLRIGVIALTGAIAAVGQTPELATPLPFTTTSLADVLDLDASLSSSLEDALQGTDLEAALGQVDGLTVVDNGDHDPDTLAFTYDRSVTADLALVHDDGDLRFGANDGAGRVKVDLVTRDSAPFVVAIDPSQADPLLRVALISQPQMDLSVDIETGHLDPFPARQGFTAVDVSGGHYRIHRDQLVTMRDPDGRGLLTLEDLRYSTLPDLFRITTQDDDIDVRLDLELPDSLGGGDDVDRSGTLTVSEASTPTGGVWPAASDADRSYGATLTQATDLSMVDGLTSLAQYTGAVLALQDAADVPFPNLAGGTSDLFTPGDDLLALLSTAASAQVACGVSAANPPTGVAAPGDTVYCQATTSVGLGTPSDVAWSLHDAGTIVSQPAEALGEAPSGVVEISGSDGEPDLEVSFTAGKRDFTARSMPHTVQDVLGRIKEISGSSATAELSAGRLDVDLAISQASRAANLAVGNSGTLGALVGLTGLGASASSDSGGDEEDPATARAVATGSSFDVGFGIQTGALEQGAGRQTYLLPDDGTLLSIDGLSATPPTTVTDLPARIGFLGVTADLTDLELGTKAGSKAVTLERVTSGGAQADSPLPISDLLTKDGALDPDQLHLSSGVTARIAFEATEKPLPGSAGFATGTAGGASGTASVSWGPAGLPTVGMDEGYGRLRVFDPVPAAFVRGTAQVTEGTDDAPDSVQIDVTSLPDGTTLYDLLNLAPSSEPVQVARRLMTDGATCQNATVDDATTLTCEELAPNGVPAFADGADVQAIVLGDPFALRDSVIEGLSATLADLGRLDGDHVAESTPLAFDQYASTLPLVDLTPAQLAVERDALQQGLAAVDAAATADEQGASTTPVSSAQELSESVDELVALGSAHGYDPSLAFTLGADTLGVALTAHAPDGTVLRAPLRLDDVGTSLVPGRGQVMSGSTAAGDATLPVGVSSATTLAIDVDRATARPAIADASGTESTATLSRTGGQLDGHPLQAGVTSLTVQGAGSSAALGVKVRTDYVAGGSGDDGRFETRRTNARQSGRAATAELAVGPGDVISYAADATDSSGGSGAAQPAPDPMQVTFLAEGLDGLSSALASAMDGAAPRNLDPDTGAPVSAPLIGTELDAGAGVPDTLTSLTSALRDQLAKPAVAGAEDAATLEAALDDAVAAAVNATAGLKTIHASDVTVHITCGDVGGACTPCDDPDPADTDPPVCTTDEATGWDDVTVSFGLTGLEKTGTTPFQTGLAGLEVRSDKNVDTTTSWSLPVTLDLKRGVGPQVVVGNGDALQLKVDAEIPSSGIDAIVGYLPAHLDPTDGELDTTIEIAPTAGSYDLFQLYDGELTAQPSFADGTVDESGIELGFDTLAQDKGVFGLSGTIGLPWTAEDGFGEVTYDDVKLDVGDVVAAIATPFQVVDPYLAPVRDVVDVLRAPIPVVSDLSELAGGGEVSLLSMLETLSKATKKPQLELAHRVIGLVGGVTDMIHALAPLSKAKVPLKDLEAVGALLTVEPSDVALYSKCTETVRTTTTTTNPDGTSTSNTVKKAPEPCPDGDALAEEQAKPGAAGQTTDSNRKGDRKTAESVSTKTTEVTGQLPGFSLPFLSDPDQLMDLLTGEGEASYFRLDLGTLSASVAYNQKFGPIMAGPIPIVPFVGGSISVEGRLAMGFDSYAQTLAARSVAAGDVDDLLSKYADFDGGNIIREGFYIDDLDDAGVDVPEVKVVTTLEAGASVSIGIVSAGLKGSITLTINLDLNDPNDDGRLRSSEIRTMFGGNAACIFDVSATLGAAISVFVEIELLFTSLEYEFDILRLGPYTLFEYGCPDVVPTLVIRNGSNLQLTSGGSSGSRYTGATDVPDDFKVRQFDKGSGLTTYEVSGFGRVQNIDVKKQTDDWKVTIYQSGLTTSTGVKETYTTTTRPTFRADGGQGKDKISFLAGEEYADDGSGGEELVNTPFDTQVSSLTGGPLDDVLVAGDADDRGIDGGDGNDSISTGLGDDVATGGNNDDIMDGGAGQDDLAGGGGNDRVSGGPGADRVAGQDGNDSLVGGTGRDVRALLVRPRGSEDGVVAQQVRLGFDSGDIVVGGAGTDTVDGGDGSDVVIGGDADSLLTASRSSVFGTGTRTVNVLAQGATEDDDPAFITEDVDVPTANVPSDSALDTLCVSGAPVPGADSTDIVTGGPEKDVVVGGNGPDTLNGGSGPDEICGRAGDDQLSGDDADAGDSSDSTQDADVIRGGAGDDRADGGPGNDLVFGDDVNLVRHGIRVVNGSLGADSSGSGADFLDGGDGDDILAAGRGSDLVLGDAGDDATYGEGRDTAEQGGTAPPVSERLLACNATTRVVRGLVDLDGDLFAGAGGNGLEADTGQMAGLDVVDGAIRSPGGTSFQGLLAGEVVVVNGRVDLDRDGTTVDDNGDTGMINLPSMLGTGANSDGDCVLAGDGDDEMRGGAGSDYLGAGAGTDLVAGGDGNDLALGDDGTDVLLGGPHSDVLVGGSGDDQILGNDGDDRLRGNDGADNLVGGSDTSGAGDGQDVLLGGRAEDVLVAENGAAVTDAIVGTVSEAPWSGDGITPRSVTAGDGSDLVFDGSALTCTTGETGRYLTSLEDDGVDGVPVASPGTPLAYDELYGGFGCDFVLGSTGDDIVRGGQDEDVVEGGPGDDLANGDDGDDVVVGGSSLDLGEDTRYTDERSGAGQPDGDDTVRGDGGPDAVDGSDIVVGDNAVPLRVASLAAEDDHVGPAYVVQLTDVPTLDNSPAGTTHGADTLTGDGASDVLLGQGGPDTLSGGPGDDHLEGNDGADDISAGDGGDDVLGGSSAADGLPLGDDGTRLAASLGGPFDASAAGPLDVGRDSIDAGDGDDVVLGDNGRITRQEDAARQIARADELGTDQVSDGDDVAGGAGLDRIFGQGGDDTVDAGSETDHVEGNEGDDTLTGGTGADVVIGGSSLSPDNRGALGDAVAVARTQLDGDDDIEGDERTPGAVSADLLLGDNATVLDLGDRLVVQLADVATTDDAPAVGTSGDDTIDGGRPGAANAAVSDRVLGQGGDDTVTTGPADDYVEGGAGDDTITTDAGDDDVLGGSSALDGRPFGDLGTRLEGRGESAPGASAPALLDGVDDVDAGAGDDVVLGDNGLLTRPSAVDGRRADGTRLRTVQLYDVVTSTRAARPGVGAGDTLDGDDDRDLLFGQAGDDAASGGGDDDYLEGEVGDDSLDGDEGEDDLVGGGSSNDGAMITVSGSTVTDRLLTPVRVATDTSAAGLVDGNDVVDGGADRDVALGDNGRITRDGAGTILSGGASGPHVVRQVAMGDQKPGVWSGSDSLYGGAGDDDLYGQFDNTLTSRAFLTYQGAQLQGDLLDGGTGDDALVGDQGVDVPTPVAVLGAVDRTVTDKSGFFREVVRPRGTLVRVVTLSQSTVGGDDLLLGGDGGDSLHGGAGNDVSNAGAGDDVVLAGDGADALWGGLDHDRMFGGAGDDVLDTKRRTSDPALWKVAAPVEDTDWVRQTRNGRDVLYGGSGADALQADEGDTGRSRRMQGDRLVDWTSTINFYKTCDSGYGRGKVRNEGSSSMTTALRQLAAASGSVGSPELAIPGNQRITKYRNKGSFVCETR